MKLKSHIFFDLAVLLFFAFLVWEAREWRLQARLFPWVVGIPMIVLAVIQLALDFSGKKLGNAGSGSAPVDFQLTGDVPPELARRRTVGIFSWILGALAGIWLLGFSLTLPALVFLYLKIQARRGWTLSLILTALAWLLLWGLFKEIIHLPFPEGKLFLWLGF